MNRSTLLVIFLVAMGAAWGLTLPLAKVAVSGGYRHFGIIFWQTAIGATVLGAYLLWRGKWPLWNARKVAFCVMIALIGTILPNGASYQAAVYLPAGVLSILIATVPMIAFPIALGLNIDRFDWLRATGLLVGLASVALLVGPDASLPDPAMAIFIPLALIAPALYAVEDNIIAKWGTWGLDPIETLFGASAIGCVIALPVAILTGSWIDPRPPWGLPDGAVVLSSTVHAFVYASYVWMIARAGAVFASQVAYLVTGFGVLWSMLLLGETFSLLAWLAIGLMFVGLFLVRPRIDESVAQT